MLIALFFECCPDWVAAMPQSYLIIDGYNFMYARGDTQKKFGPGGLEKARSRNLGFLAAHLDADERRRTTVVFDGTEGRGRHVNWLTDREMAIAFSPRGVEADAVIEELLLEHPAPRQIVVVSSDHRLQRAARRRRSQFLDSEDFARYLEYRGRRSGREKPVPIPPELLQKRGETLSTSETEHWLDIFQELASQYPEPGEQIDLQQEVDGIADSERERGVEFKKRRRKRRR